MIKEIFPLGIGAQFTPEHDDCLKQKYQQSGYLYDRIDTQQIVVVPDLNSVSNRELERRVKEYADFLNGNHYLEKIDHAILDNLGRELDKNPWEILTEAPVLLHQVGDTIYALIEPFEMHRVFVHHARSIPIPAIVYQAGQKWSFFNHNKNNWEDIPHHRDFSHMTANEWLAYLNKQYRGRKVLLDFSQMHTKTSS